MCSVVIIFLYFAIYRYVLGCCTLKGTNGIIITGSLSCMSVHLSICLSPMSVFHSLFNPNVYIIILNEKRCNLVLLGTELGNTRSRPFLYKRTYIYVNKRILILEVNFGGQTKK